MKALHSKKVAAEKDAVLDELLAGLPKSDELKTGRFAVRARRLHERFLPLHIVSHFRPIDGPLSTDYFEALASHWIESECLFSLGFRNSAMSALRATLEAAMKLVYYENHPIEWQLHKSGSHDLTGMEFREFFYKVPGLSDLSFNSRDFVEPLWSELCKFVHCDLRSIKTISVIADIQTIFAVPEKQFALVTQQIQDVAKIAVSCCLSVDPAWLKSAEKAYFDAVLGIYSNTERSQAKLALQIV